MNEPALKLDDHVDRLIAEHNGDVRVAIAVHGFARGWKSKLTSKS